MISNFVVRIKPKSPGALNIAFSKQTHLFLAFRGFFCFTLLRKDADLAVDAVVARYDLELSLPHEHYPLVYLGRSDLLYPIEWQHRYDKLMVIPGEFLASRKMIVKENVPAFVIATFPKKDFRFPIVVVIARIY